MSVTLDGDDVLVTVHQVEVRVPGGRRLVVDEDGHRLDYDQEWELEDAPTTAAQGAFQALGWVPQFVRIDEELLARDTVARESVASEFAELGEWALVNFDDMYLSRQQADSWYDSYASGYVRLEQKERPFSEYRRTALELALAEEFLEAALDVWPKG